jgi:hypothetical protein
VDAGQIGLLEKRKRRFVSALCLTAVILLLISAFRFIPRLNDALSGSPEYIRILTETFARQLATQTQMQFPVIVEHDERVLCQAVTAPSIPDEEIRGTIYILTYSEQQHLTCITTYVVPTDASTFPVQRSVTPANGKNYGTTLLATVQAVPQDRIFHTYAAEYLKRLHWRYKPHFPLSPGEAASLRSQSYYSGAKPAGDSAVSIDFDYGELRAGIGKGHRRMNVALSSLLVGCVLVSLFLLQRLWRLYGASLQCCSLYELKLTPGIFLRGNLATKFNAARREYFERRQETQARLREQEKLRTLKAGWQEALRSALPNLNDDQLRGRVQECLEHEPEDLERMKSLWIEVQERMGLKTPAAKIDLLLESAKPYCTEEEFLAGRAEAFAILNKSGFRAARTFVTTMHDQFKARAREMEELEGLEDSRQSIA